MTYRDMLQVIGFLTVIACGLHIIQNVAVLLFIVILLMLGNKVLRDAERQAAKPKLRIYRLPPYDPLHLGSMREGGTPADWRN